MRLRLGLGAALASVAATPAAAHGAFGTTSSVWQGAGHVVLVPDLALLALALACLIAPRAPGDRYPWAETIGAGGIALAAALLAPMVGAPPIAPAIVGAIVLALAASVIVGASGSRAVRLTEALLAAVLFGWVLARETDGSAPLFAFGGAAALVVILGLAYEGAERLVARGGGWIIQTVAAWLAAIALLWTARVYF
ncbi:MAG: hypothetical protein GC199_04840 [Alphaproteobacteria bacterium]|nr:hypothetical protein [Alphaproteobacteria bacterium]